MSKSKFSFCFMLLFAVIFTPNCLAGEPAEEVSIEALPPSVVKTVPQCGDDNVDPGLSKISVTFSKDMKVIDHCWSWCSIGMESYPKTTAGPEFLKDKRTCVLPVELEPEKTYVIWINLAEYQSFQDPEGHPCVPYQLVFKTGPGKKSK